MGEARLFGKNGFVLEIIVPYANTESGHESYFLEDQAGERRVLQRDLDVVISFQARVTVAEKIAANCRYCIFLAKADFECSF